MLIILIAGIIGGFINAVSAAGSLITLPAFIFAGLTPGAANASNRVAILAQNFSSAYAFRSKGLKPDAYMFWLAAASIPGAVLGAWFSLKIPDALFTKILSVVMVVFLIITLVNPLKNAGGKEERLDTRSKIIGVLLYFCFGIYGGFIQAGTGFFLMGGALLLHRFNIVKTNYYKAVIMFTYTLAAFLVFMFKGNIHWLEGILMGVGMSIGAFFGSRWTIGASEVWIRRVMVVLICSMAAYLWIFK